MHYNVFDAEQWMTRYEKQVRVNLADTSVAPLAFSDISHLNTSLFDQLILDYGDIAGNPELRRLILSNYKNQDEATLALSHGCLQANCAVMEALLEKGDEVITFVPGYYQFISLPETLGCQVKTAQYKEPDWRPDLDELEKLISDKTKLIIINQANNPTGTIWKKEEMERLIELARKNDSWILCDEVYRFPDAGLPSMSDAYEKGIATGSLSKLYGAAGARLGWIKGPEALIDKIDIMKDYTWISTGPLADAVALTLLQRQDDLVERAREYIRRNTDLIKDWLCETPWFECVIEKDATVAFLKYRAEMGSVELCKKLIDEEGIFFVPGIFFGKEGFLRLGLGQDQADLLKHLNRLDRFMENLNTVKGSV